MVGILVALEAAKVGCTINRIVNFIQAANESLCARLSLLSAQSAYLQSEPLSLVLLASFASCLNLGLVVVETSRGLGTLMGQTNPHIIFM